MTKSLTISIKMLRLMRVKSTYVEAFRSSFGSEATFSSKDDFVREINANANKFNWAHMASRMLSGKNAFKFNPETSSDETYPALIEYRKTMADARSAFEDTEYAALDKFTKNIAPDVAAAYWDQEIEQ